MAGTLTAANSVVAMTVEGLFPAAQVWQGYSADDAYDFEAVENGEYSMGIDGKLSAGFVYNEVPFTGTFQADSPTLALFEQIYQYEQENRTKLQINITVTQVATGKRYDLKSGFMRSFKAASAKKILQPGVAAFVFARLQPSPL